MTTNTIDAATLKPDLKKLKFALIVLTIILVGYSVLLFTSTEWVIKLHIHYGAKWYIAAFNFFIKGIFIWYNWKKLPIDKKTRTNNTYMLILLGVIGMWLWMPNRLEREKMVMELERE